MCMGVCLCAPLGFLMWLEIWELDEVRKVKVLGNSAVLSRQKRLVFGLPIR